MFLLHYWKQEGLHELKDFRNWFGFGSLKKFQVNMPKSEKKEKTEWKKYCSIFPSLHSLVCPICFVKRHISHRGERLDPWAAQERAGMWSRYTYLSGYAYMFALYVELLWSFKKVLAFFINRLSAEKGSALLETNNRRLQPWAGWNGKGYIFCSIWLRWRIKLARCIVPDTFNMTA